MNFWKDKTVFLTGASSGIGEAIAVEMAKRGAILGLVARRKEQLLQIAQKIESLGGTVSCFPCDVKNKHDMFGAALNFRNEFGKIDILVANAGIGGNNEKTRNLVPGAVAEVIDINLIGAVNSVSAVLPDMLEKGSGQLVAVSSLAGIRGLPRSAAYSASKAGMTAFFESVRLDVQKRGVAVSIIQPGFIKTPLTSGRENKMPFIMELEDAVPLFLNAIEKQKKFASFPWQLAWFVRAGKVFPAWLYDRIAAGTKFRE